MVGGAQLIRMLIGIVNTKFGAVLLGPAGIGLIGAYQVIIQLSNQLSELGIGQSGVRDIAAAAGSNEKQRIAKAVAILRRMCWLTGSVGMIGLLVLAYPISKVTFGESTYAVSLMFLSFVILFTAVARGQMAVIQGLRRIADLVRIQILGSVAGCIVSITFYFTLGMSGIVPSLLSIAFFNLGVTWWFSRKIYPASLAITWQETFSGAKSLVGLGIAFMIGGLATTFTAYAARVLIVRDIGIEALGFYQAAFAISGYMLNFVLGAMGADFYPRLAGVPDDHEEMRRLVNEQTEIGLLLATPALIATLALAPLAIRLLYTAEFVPAVDLLRWFVMGCFLRVISWPMGFIQLAMGEKFWFIFSQTVFNALYILFIFIGIRLWGLRGTAIAFFAMYVLHVFGIFLIARHLIGFSWSRETKILIFTQVSAVMVTFCAALMLPEFWSMLLGGVMFLLVGVHSLRQLLVRLGEEHKLCRLITKIPGSGLLLWKSGVA